MRTLALVAVCTLIVGCKGFQPTPAGDDIVGPAGESSTTMIGTAASAVFGEDVTPVVSSIVGTVAALWLWRKRKALAAAVTTK